MSGERKEPDRESLSTLILEPATPWWFWVFIGLVIGFLIGFAV